MEVNKVFRWKISSTKWLITNGWVETKDRFITWQLPFIPFVYSHIDVTFHGLGTTFGLPPKTKSQSLNNWKILWKKKEWWRRKTFAPNYIYTSIVFSRVILVIFWFKPVMHILTSLAAIHYIFFFKLKKCIYLLKIKHVLVTELGTSCDVAHCQILLLYCKF